MSREPRSSENVADVDAPARDRGDGSGAEALPGRESPGGRLPDPGPGDEESAPVRLGTALFRWARDRARSYYGALGLTLTVALLVSGLACWAFIEIAWDVMEGETRAFDLAVLRWMEAHGTRWLDTAALEATQLGSNLVLFMTVLISATVFWITGHRFSAVALVLAVVGSMILNYALKLAFGRPRPDLLQTLEAPVSSGLSFPSGHAMTTTVTYVTLAYLLGRLLTRPHARAIAAGIAALVVLLVGVSRVYIGVHFPSDVLAGFAAGFVWATACVVVIRVAGRFPDPARAPRDGG